MDGVDVFLDTGVMFRALGYFGRARERAATELLDICKATGCRLKAFDHNVSEVVEGLLAVASRLHAGANAFGPIVSYAIEEGLEATDLIEASQRVPDDLKKVGVEIVEPPSVDKETSINETMLEWRVEVDVKQNSQIARVRDVRSLSAIYR